MTPLDAPDPFVEEARQERQAARAEHTALLRGLACPPLATAAGRAAGCLSCRDHRDQGGRCHPGPSSAVGPGGPGPMPGLSKPEYLQRPSPHRMACRSPVTPSVPRLQFHRLPEPGHCPSDRQRLQQGIPSVKVVVDSDPRRQIVGQVVQLPPAIDRHKDAAGTLLDGCFNDRHGVEDGFEGATQVQATAYSETALDALLEER